jgi:hypothetical protein
MIPAPSATLKYSRLILLFSLITFSFLICVDWVEIIDDAYIYLRYVYNIVNGNGYVYNQGESVEATTSLTWTLILALTHWLSISPELGVRILGYMCGISIVILLWLELRKLYLPSGLLLLILILFVTNRSFYASTMMGLETGLYSLLLVLIYYVSDWYHTSSTHRILLGIIGLLLFLTRPEAILILMLIIVGIYFFGFDDKKQSIPFVFIIITGVLLTGLVRYIVFNDFIPNSVRNKSLLFQSFSYFYILLPRLAAGLLYIAKWLLSAPFLILPALLGITLLKAQFSYKMFVAISIILTGFAVTILNSGDWMPFNRLLTPYLPVVTILSSISLSRYLQNQRWLSLKQINIVSAMSVFVITVFCLWAVWPINFFNSDRWSAGICYVEAGKLIQPYLTQESLIAPEGIGAIGYELKDVAILDYFGLTEPYITNNGTIPRAIYNMGKHHYEYTMTRQPDLFFFHSDLRNHIHYLNKWDYSEKYSTYKLTSDSGELTIGIKISLVDSLLQPLQTGFDTQQVDTEDIGRNSAATWPFGEK